MAASLTSTWPGIQFPRQTALSRTACSACRFQKIKCSRSQPACTRCVRRRLPCFYPEPPNRRRLNTPLAVNGNSATRKSLLQENAMDEQAIHDEYLASSLGQSHSAIPSIRDAPSPTGSPFTVKLNHLSTLKHADCETTTNPTPFIPIPLRTKLPELEIGLLLIEVYFSRIWTATLLFDHRSFIKDYRASKVPEHVLLSIFALATLFFRASLPKSCGKENGLAAFAPMHEMGRAWAESASQLVLMHADRPSISNIQACEVLSLYWFAVGQLDRSTMHCGVSRESYRLLQQKAARKSGHSRGLGYEYSRVPQRLSWACSIKRCLMGTESPPEFPTLSTSNSPAGFLDEASLFERTDILSTSSTSQGPQHGAVDWLTWEETTLQSSAVYIVQLFKYWRKIKSFLHQTSYSNASAFLAAFYDTDSKLQQFYESLPYQFKGGMAVAKPSPEPLQRNAYFIRCIYYLCVMCLQSSAVPALSCTKTGFLISPEIVKLSARTVFHTARSFVEMSRGYLATRPDFTKVPSFVGYCAFVAGSVLKAVMDFQVAVESYDFSGDIQLCLILLKELTAYYRVLRPFERDLASCSRRFKQHSRSRTTVRKLLQSPGPLIMEESHSPTLTAFVNGSLSIHYGPGQSFILREYTDPYAFRYDKKEDEDSNAEEDTEDGLEQSIVRNIRNGDDPPRDLPRTETDATSHVTEGVVRDDLFSQAVQEEFLPMSLSSPFDNNFARERSGEELEGFSDLNAPSENMWASWDLSFDDMTELLPVQPFREFDWTMQ